MPEEAKGNAEYYSTAWTNPLCPYECNSKLTQYEDNPKCLTDFSLFLQNMGGL